jgi:transcriptional regulator with XRE-family HTH domain
MANGIEPFYEFLGSRIQEVREQKKMTQAQLGLSLVPPSTRASIANIENGKQRVLVHTLVQFAKAMGVPVQSLLPPVEKDSRLATPRDVELELKRKLKLPSPQLKKLVGAARPSRSNNRKRA